MTILEHSTYSPDLALNDFFLYLEIREMLRGAHFAGEEIVKKPCMGMLKHIPQEAFQECFNSWTVCMEKYVIDGREYIEGYKY